MLIKNKIVFFIILILVSLSFSFNSNAEELDISAEEIIVENNGKLVIAKGSVVIIDEIFLSKYENINSLVVVCNTKSIKEVINFKSFKTHISSISAKHMGDMSRENFVKKNFEDLAYFEPMYIKKPYVD